MIKKNYRKNKKRKKIMFKKLKEFFKIKIYCKDCIYFKKNLNNIGECNKRKILNHDKITGLDVLSGEYYNYKELNKDNDCKYYESALDIACRELV